MNIIVWVRETTFCPIRGLLKLEEVTLGEDQRHGIGHDIFLDGGPELHASCKLADEYS